MERKKLIKRLTAVIAAVILVSALMISYLASAAGAEESETEETVTEEAGSETEEAGTGTEESTDTTDIDLTDATEFVFSDEDITVSEGIYSGYQTEGTALTIKDSGIYVISGSCENGTVTVKKNVTDVTLVLNGLELSASATAPVTCNKGSEVCIFVMEDTVNTLADDEYNNDDLYTDEKLYPDVENAVIKCKDGSNVTICGSGTLQITANGKNGIKGGGELYEENAEGDETESSRSAASLTIKEVTLQITAEVNDALKADQELNILSGTLTISAADDAIKSDYVLNIGAEDTEGPVIEIVRSKEGIEAAELNVYSGDITVNASDDGINAANSDLENYSFSYNQYGGYVYVNVTNGDGIDSNGTINLYGGTLEVCSPSMGDGDPLDSEYGTNFAGATVYAAGHLGMPQGYSAETPYVVFGDSFGGMMGGFGPMGGFGGRGDAGQNGGSEGRGDAGQNGGSDQTSLVTAGSTIRIVDAEGEVLYETEAVRDASYILFSSPELESGAVYTLEVDGEDAAEAAAGTESTAGMGGMMPGGRGDGGFQMPGGGDGQFQFPGGQDGGFQFPGGEGYGQWQFPGENDNGSVPSEDGSRPTPPENGPDI